MRSPNEILRRIDADLHTLYIIKRAGAGLSSPADGIVRNAAAQISILEELKSFITEMKSDD